MLTCLREGKARLLQGDGSEFLPEVDAAVKAAQAAAQAELEVSQCVSVVGVSGGGDISAWMNACMCVRNFFGKPSSSLPPPPSPPPPPSLPPPTPQRASPRSF